jgi:hypothetical protein
MNRPANPPANPFLRELPWIASCAAGYCLWLAASAMTGAREAWDHPLYFALVLPAGLALLFAGGWHAPWPAGQMLGMLASLDGAGALLPLGIVAMVVLHVPGHAAALLAAWWRRRTNPSAGA